MKKGKWIIVAVIAALLAVSVFAFYSTVFKDEEAPDLASFAENLEMPDGITMNDKVDRPQLPSSSLREGEIEIYDEVVNKTLLMEIEKAQLQKATKRDMEEIDAADRVLFIKAVYKQEASKADRLLTVEVMNDKTFIVSKNHNGKIYYAKGKFSPYTMDYLVGLYALMKQQ
ncbi:MAG: hypothetical protein K0R84_2155 [Clostridia bacterium]|nr:hypothetical protein [Clostridia bacterium]